MFLLFCSGRSPTCAVMEPERWTRTLPAGAALDDDAEVCVGILLPARTPCRLESGAGVAEDGVETTTTSFCC